MLKVTLGFRYRKPLRLDNGEIWYNGYSVDGRPTDESDYKTVQVDMTIEFLCDRVDGLMKFVNIRDCTPVKGMPPRSMLDAIEREERECFPKRGVGEVFNYWYEDGCLCGQIDVEDVRAFTVEETEKGA